MTGPGWVQLPRQRLHPKAPMVVLIPNVAMVFTPCHGARHVYPQHQAIAGAWLQAVCDDCDTRLTVELQADPTAESGLRAHWPDTTLEETR